jgi:hypothetical protein
MYPSFLSFSKTHTHIFAIDPVFRLVFCRYGYVDPKGEIREFKYSSGVACDPITKRAFGTSAASKRLDKQIKKKPKKGYFDYSDNKFVLPDGRRVKVVVNKKNRARG